MTKAGSEGDQYLREYPHLLKWINQCAACQHRGRKPEMPAEIFPGVAARNLRRYFDELALTTIYRAGEGSSSANVGIARWTLPVWLYVSVTGVVVYWMLYRL